MLFLYREDYYSNENTATSEDSNRNSAECIIAKNRHGETRTVPAALAGRIHALYVRGSVSAMNKLRELAGRLIEEENLLPSTGTVIVGLSGGADSVALTHYLQQKVGKERLLCVHVNHGLRGEEALQDENFVQDSRALRNRGAFPAGFPCGRKKRSGKDRRRGGSLRPAAAVRVFFLCA